MNQSDIIDKTIKQVAQSFNQMLLKTEISNSNSNLIQNNPLHDNVTNVQSTSDSNTSANIQPSHLQ